MIRESVRRGQPTHPFVKRRIAHPLATPSSFTTVGASKKAPLQKEMRELICVLGAATSPDEEQAYSAAELETIIPFSENPLRELELAARSRWLH